jgi:hypothetical protein
VQTLLAVEAKAAFDVDPIEEMRLRTWARQHYTRQEERNGTWHPIVLDEMTRKDREAGSLPRQPR